MNSRSLLNDYRKYLAIDKDTSKNHVDLSHIDSITPCSVLPAIYFAELNGIDNYRCYDAATHNHLNKILKKAPRTRDILPLIDINLDEDMGRDEKCESLKNLKNQIDNHIFPDKNYSSCGEQSSCMFILEEIIKNIADHSNATKVYSYSQTYPNYIDIGILDNGDTIPGIYEKSKSEFVDKDINPYKFENDHEAIFRSSNGISTREPFKREIKPLTSVEAIFECSNLSLGINRSIRLVTECLSGSFFLASREGICHLTQEEKTFLKSEKADLIDGTFICLRLNKANLNKDEYHNIIDEKHNRIYDDKGILKIVS